MAEIKTKTRFKKIAAALGLIIFLLVTVQIPTVFGADTTSVEILKKNIDDRNAKIEQLNKEIEQLDGQIQEASKQGQTLKGTIGVLDAQRGKLAKELETTQNEVSAATLSISKLGIEINDKEKEIEESKMALGDAIRNMNRAENYSLVETLFTYANAAELWNEIEALSRFQAGLKENIESVRELKTQLADKKSQNETKQKSLLGLKSELEDQKKVVEINKSEKAKLLTETRSKEEAYRLQLEEKKRLGEQFLKDIAAYESQLKFLIDPTSYPAASKGILSWPLDDIYVTQYFGDTAFAKSTNAYNGKGHNGIDFRASPGTKVLTALSGTVTGVGNTDLVAGCYSYGQWVLVKHDNGLSTLYAHLSLIKAVAGQRVATGDIIGYSGYTGYVVPAGPAGAHLHFGVYASQGVKIVKYANSINCKNAVIPVADIRAYLNPILYLP